VVLTIEQSWGQAPGWLGTLPREMQTDLLALHRLRLSEGKGGKRAAGKRGRRT
jgi:hypothetical protein